MTDIGMQENYLDRLNSVTSDLATADGLSDEKREQLASEFASKARKAREATVATQTDQQPAVQSSSSEANDAEARRRKALNAGSVDKQLLEQTVPPASITTTKKLFRWSSNRG